MNTTRPQRTAIAGARAQFAGIVADVVNASPTGALIRTAHQQPRGAEWPLVLEFNDTSFPLPARVVRCEPVVGPLSTSKGQFVVALVFVNASAEAQALLEQACRVGRRAEAQFRRVRVSLTRRCPACNSRHVARKSPRRYSCCRCGQMFAGLRVGFLRFAR